MSSTLCSFVPTAIEFGTVVTQAPSTYFATAQLTFTGPAVVTGTSTSCHITINPDTGATKVDSCSAVIEEMPPTKSVSDVLIPITTTVEYTLSTPSLTKYQTVCPASSATTSPTSTAGSSQSGSHSPTKRRVAVGVSVGVFMFVVLMLLICTLVCFFEP